MFFIFGEESREAKETVAPNNQPKIADQATLWRMILRHCFTLRGILVFALTIKVSIFGVSKTNYG